MIKNLVIVALITLSVSFGWALYHQPARQYGKLPVEVEQIVQNEVATAPSAIDPANTVPVVPVFDDDYISLTDQLRSAGYGEDSVRGILLMSIERDHLLEQQSNESKPYWLLSQTDPRDEVRIELDWLSQKRLQLQALFGDEIIDDPLFADLFKPLNSTLPFLTSDKQIQLYELQLMNHAKSQMLRSLGYIREARADYQQISEQLQNQIREVLTSDEYFEYQLRQSRLAKEMQRSMASFDYTEQEFRDLYAIRSYNEVGEFNRFTNRSLMSENRQVSDAQIRDYLTTDRYAEYTRSQDPVFRSIQSIGNRYGNSSDEIVAVYEITHQANMDAVDIRGTLGLNRQERNDQILEIRELSYRKIEALAGKETADSVKSNTSRMGLGVHRRDRF